LLSVVLVSAGCSRSDDEFNRAVAAGYAAGLSLGMEFGERGACGGVWPTLLVLR
jgi:hypothetical protein